MDPGYERALKAVADDSDLEIVGAEFIDSEGPEKPARIKQAGPLRWILVSLCAGSVSAMLRRENTSNRFESRRKLLQRYRILSKARAVGRRTKILEPSGME